MDHTIDQVEAVLHALKPDFLFFDFPYWAPTFAFKLGIKSIYYNTICASVIAHHPPSGQQVSKDNTLDYR